MVADVTIFGAEESPYSVKVRSYFRYKSPLSFEFVGRNVDPEKYQKHAKLPLVPLVVLNNEDSALQDSTPIIDTLEDRFGEPSLHPEDDICRFISILLEEFGDEWGNKWMFHYRWYRDADSLACATRLARSGNPGMPDDVAKEMVAKVLDRMVNRIWFVGSNETTAPLIEHSFQTTIKLLDDHLAHRPYLFGARPGYADFALWAQIYETNRDPTPMCFINQTEHVQSWVARMVDPSSDGDFESWESVQSTLLPLLEKIVGAQFLPWSVANAAAIERGQEEFTTELQDGTWTQKPQRYHAKSLAVLRQKFVPFQDNAELRKVLEQTGCLQHLTLT